MRDMQEMNVKTWKRIVSITPSPTLKLHSPCVNHCVMKVQEEPTIQKLREEENGKSAKALEYTSRSCNGGVERLSGSTKIVISFERHIRMTWNQVHPQANARGYNFQEECGTWIKTEAIRPSWSFSVIAIGRVIWCTDRPSNWAEMSGLYTVCGLPTFLAMISAPALWISCSQLLGVAHLCWTIWDILKPETLNKRNQKHNEEIYTRDSHGTTFQVC